jgi:hypothetical protein
MGSRALKIDPQKSPTSDRDAQPDPIEAVDEAAIAERAYEYWQQRGCPIGTDQEDWFRAERELKNSGGKRSTSSARTSPPQGAWNSGSPKLHPPL